MKIIGITGGVGAGKSAILDYIEDNYNALILKADEVAHQLMEPGTACYAALQAILPAEAFQKDGHLDRAVLAKLMFSSENLRIRMNGIVHPAVKVYIRECIAREQALGRLDYLVIEAALLIEERYDEICDQLWYIYTSEENRRQRLIESRGYSKEKITQIFASQLPEAEYRRKCQAVIDNNGELADTFIEVRRAFEQE